MSLVVNLYGGPGTGKSTNAALIFGKLKLAGVSAELVPEYAKGAVWEGRHKVLSHQPYVIGKQTWWIERCLDQVEVVVTDSPILLAYIYANETAGTHFLEHVRATHERWNTLDIFLHRHPGRPYVEAGRSQTREQAKVLDGEIADVLVALKVPHQIHQVTTDERCADRIALQVLAAIEPYKAPWIASTG